MKNFKKLGIVLGSMAILLGSTIVFSEPGSSKDPLVSMSYVDNKIDQLKVYIDEKLKDNTSSEQGGIVESASAEFNVVNLKRGQSIILGGGSEIILRSGKALAISRIENGIDNGLCDVTAGVDLSMDQKLKANHLLLTPRNDGRGAVAATDAIFIVRGAFEIR